MQKFTGRRIETKNANMQKHSKLLIKKKKEKSKMFSSEANQNWVFLSQYSCLKDTKFKINCVVYHLTIHQTDLLKNCFSAGKCLNTPDSHKVSAYAHIPFLYI